MKQTDGIASAIILSGFLLFFGPIIGPTAFQLLADGVSSARPSGVYSNRRHHEMLQTRTSPCPPDYDRVRELAEEATGARAPHVRPGTYHTDSRDVNPHISSRQGNILPGSVEMKVQLQHMHIGNFPVDLNAYQQIPLGDKVGDDIGDGSRNTVGEDARRDCLDTQK